jgi:hypothetical protein
MFIVRFLAGVIVVAAIVIGLVVVAARSADG